MLPLKDHKVVINQNVQILNLFYQLLLEFLERSLECSKCSETRRIFLRTRRNLAIFKKNFEKGCELEKVKRFITIELFSKHAF